jgi:hypothetical protein
MLQSYRKNRIKGNSVEIGLLFRASTEMKTGGILQEKYVRPGDQFEDHELKHCLILHVELIDSYLFRLIINLCAERDILWILELIDSI